MKKRSGFYPKLNVGTASVAAVGQAGGVLLTGAVRASGLDRALSAAFRLVQCPCGWPSKTTAPTRLS